MSELDDKLREILDTEVINPIIYGEGVDPKDYFGIDSDDIIAQIKQAFADEGYSQLHYKGRAIRGEWMTGQDWYDRFLKEVLALPKDFGFLDMQEAAKKASKL